jgi:MFS family permease
MQIADSSPAAETGGPSRGFLRGWPMIWLFLLFYIFSFIDRQIITMMVDPLKRDLGLTDFQISLMMGPAFGLFFALFGLQMGWLVDRYSRRWITLAGVTLWGIATLGSGLARSFPGLLLGRMGVGMGEATLTPAAHSLIAEQFPKERLSTAIAVYSLGAVIGGGLAVVLGGAIVHLAAGAGEVHLPLAGDVRPWQLVFIVVGGITILLAPLALMVREYDRKAAKEAAHRATANASPARDMPLKRLFAQHPMLFVGLPLGFGLLNVITNAYGAWTPTFMVREFGWDVGQVGLAWGIQHIIAAAIGQVGGAMLVDWLYRRGMTDAHTRYQIWGVLIAVPINIIALWSGDPWIFLTLNAVYYILCYPFLGYAVSALQIHTPQHLRGQVSAIFLAIITIVGSGIGAPFTAFVSDHLLGDKGQLSMALIVVSVVFGPMVVIMLGLVSRKLRMMHMAGQGPA